MTTTTISSGGSTSATVTSGNALVVQAGGSAINVVVQSGGSASISGTDTNTTIQSGGFATIIGTEYASTILAGGTETVSGTVTGDSLYGTQVESASTAVVNNETIYNGGVLEMLATSGTANNITVMSGGELLLSANAPVTNLVIQGGSVLLESKKSNINGTLSFSGAGTLAETTVISSGYGVNALIEGFGANDVIDLTSVGSGATLTSSVVSGNTVETITSGTVSESFTFAGTSNDFTLVADAGSGSEIVLATPTTTTIASGASTSAGFVVYNGDTLDVLAGGYADAVTILSGGVALISGSDTSSVISAGGSETVFGSATGDQIYGTQLVSAGTAVVTSETVYSGGNLNLFLKGAVANATTVQAGGALNISGAAVASNTVLQGGSVVLESAKASIGGTLSFSGAGTLTETTVISAGYGDNAVIYGFGAGDVIDLSAIGAGASLTSTTSGGNTVVTISGGSTEGSASESFTFAGTGGTYSLSTDSAGTGEALTEGEATTTTITTSSGIPTLTSFTAGDIVISVVGDGDGSGTYTDNQAAPIVLEEIDPTTGEIVGEMVLPQTTTTDDGTTEYAISGEYGSSSEGILQLSSDGQSLVIGGYGVNADTYNEGGADEYGNAALAQSTSVEGGTYTAVPRVVADISYNGTVDTSTALYNVYNANNIRSVATVDGSTFYISGQGVAGDDTQGVFEAADGASSATTIDSSTDTRDVEIINNTLYVSQNSTQDGGTANIESFGGLPTTATTPTVLSGINESVVLQAGQGNTVNAGAVGTTVDLSPEQYFYANATTLYVADSGSPKAGTVGDGGLQKWTLNTTTGVWQLDYTLSDGLNLVDNSSVSSDTSGTTGLIGLTGTLNADGTVTFYATNSTIGDTDQTYLYTITDTVDATTAPSNETFTTVATASSDTNIRGVAEAPYAPTDITISAGQTTSAGLNVTTGSTLTVLSGGIASAVMILSGGMAYISGSDSASYVVDGGNEMIYGAATGDQIYGTQVVSGGASDETVYYGGALDLDGNGATATGTTVGVQGALDITAAATASDTVIDGGIVVLTNADAALTDGVTFVGAGAIIEDVVPNAGAGETAVIYGFTNADVIDFMQFGSGSVLTSAVSGGNTVETVTSGGDSTTVTLAGQYTPGMFALVSDNNGGVELVVASTTDTGDSTVSSGYTSEDVSITSGASVTVASGASLISATVQSGGNAIIYGTDSGGSIAAGGTMTVYGSATDDSIYGSLQVGYGGLVGNETVNNGGVLTLAANSTADNIMINGGTVLLAASDASLGGTLSFEGLGTLELTTSFNAGDGVLATISGFGQGDVIELDDIGSGATLTSTTSGGNTIETVTSGGVSDSFIFAGTNYSADYFVLAQTGTGEELMVSASNTLTISAGQTATPGYVVSSGYTLDVLSGGSANDVLVLSGGAANFAGTDSDAVVSSGGNVQVLSTGVETGATIMAGGTEMVAGNVTGDQVYGLQEVADGTSNATLTGETIFNGGTLEVLYKTNTVSATTIEAGGYMVINGNATAKDMVINGGVLELQSPKANLTGTLTFANGGTLLESAVISAGIGGDLAVIYGFSEGDVIDLSAIGTGASLTSSTSGDDTVITISGGSGEGTEAESFTFSGTGQDFVLSTDSAGTGEELTLLCFLRGTRIMTPTGEVPVEELAIGDLVVTRLNGIQPVKWIGRQSFAGRFVQENRAKIPVCIRAGAISDGVPVRDLFVSPGHSMLLGDTLVLASALVNGVTVTQDDVPDEINYYHIEFEMHDCVVADGAWSESYTETNEHRAQFHNAAEFEALYPDYRAPEKLSLCAPRPERGPDLGTALRPVLARASAGLTPGPLRGHIDKISPEKIEGWAHDHDHPELPVLVEVLMGDQVLGAVLACDYRADLEEAGFGQGRCSFGFVAPVEIPPEAVNTLRVRRANDGTEIYMTEDCKAGFWGSQTERPAKVARRRQIA
jgi:autotransporter passenger strand-loop-strand repeat protein